MAKWMRALIQPEGASTKWHVLAADKEYASASALCGEKLPAVVEATTSEARVERDGRCESCEVALEARQREGAVAGQP